MTQARWRDRWPIHEAAEVFPMLEDPLLRELGQDIKAHGLKQEIVLWSPYRTVKEEADARKRGDLLPKMLLDGRNRLAAMDLVGLDIDQMLTASTGVQRIEIVRPPTDPRSYVASVNAKRRHLTTAQKKKAIQTLLAANPTESDHSVAKKVGVSQSTVSRTRGVIIDAKHQSSREVPRTADQLKRDKITAALKADPSRSNKAIAKDAGTSDFPVRRIRKQLGLLQAKDATPIQPPQTAQAISTKQSTSKKTMPNNAPQDSTQLADPKPRRGYQVKQFDQILIMLKEITPHGLDTVKGRKALEQARDQFYRLEDGLD